jgi:hypothetical protein
MDVELPILNAADVGFDTSERSVYDTALWSPPSDSIMADRNAASEPKLVGLPGWVALKLGVPPWGQILVIVLAALMVPTFFWYLSVEKHLSSIDSSLQVLPLQIGRDLLSQASADLTLGHSKKALVATEAATALIAQASIKRIPANPDFFTATTSELNVLESHAKDNREFSGKVLSSRLILAEYRSALESVPTLQKPEKTLESTYIIVHADSKIDPNTLNATTIILPPTVEAFQSPLIRRLSNGMSIEQINFKGGVQTLDGFAWKNVVFVNTLVKYEGGETQLQNVRFVNCTFQMDNTPRSSLIASYVSLGLSALRLPPNS